jgi:hypothetical protein
MPPPVRAGPLVSGRWLAEAWKRPSCAGTPPTRSTHGPCQAEESRRSRHASTCGPWPLTPDPEHTLAPRPGDLGVADQRHVVGAPCRALPGDLRGMRPDRRALPAAQQSGIGRDPVHCMPPTVADLDRKSAIRTAPRPAGRVSTPGAGRTASPTGPRRWPAARRSSSPPSPRIRRQRRRRQRTADGPVAAHPQATRAAG